MILYIIFKVERFFVDIGRTDTDNLEFFYILIIFFNKKFTEINDVTS